MFFAAVAAVADGSAARVKRSTSVEPIMNAAPTVAAAAVEARSEPTCVAERPDVLTMFAATPTEACTTFPTMFPAIIRTPAAAIVPAMETVLEATAVAVFPEIFVRV